DEGKAKIAEWKTKGAFKKASMEHPTSAKDLLDEFQKEWPYIIKQCEKNETKDKEKSFGRHFIGDLISWGNVQPISYNPYVAENCFTYYPNRLIYSLPQSLEAIRDYWQVFLTFNYKDFKSKVISVKPYDQSGVIIFTEKDSPVMTRTVENLELDLGTKLKIGDGSLFSQPLQSFSNADSAYQYASTQDPLSVINTPLGLFYIAQSQGKIFGIGQSLEEISTAGLKW
ncbi:MAG: hypothetical protein ACK55I_36410, partial [bacterium]